MKRLISLLLAVLLLGLCGCAQLEQQINERLPQAYDTDLLAMDTAIHLRIYGDDDGQAAAALQTLLQGAEQALSVTDTDSALYTLNHYGQSSDPTILALLPEAAALCSRTGGAVDPSVYPAVLLWGFTGDTYRVPQQQELEDILPALGMEHVRFDAHSVTLDEGTMLDFGAFAKGWASDECRTLLKARGMSAVLTLGGSVITVGQKPEGGDWVIGIADPDQPDTALLELHLQGSHAVATSGDYQRYFEYEGERYCHILDPETGRPVSNGLRSVTVVCSSGLTADGLSTALFVMGLDRAIEFWRSSDDFEAVFITADGELYATAGLQEALGDQPVTVIAR